MKIWLFFLFQLVIYLCSYSSNAQIWLYKDPFFSRNDLKLLQLNRPSYTLSYNVNYYTKWSNWTEAWFKRINRTTVQYAYDCKNIRWRACNQTEISHNTQFYFTLFGFERVSKMKRYVMKCSKRFILEETSCATKSSTNFKKMKNSKRIPPEIWNILIFHLFRIESFNWHYFGVSSAFFNQMAISNINHYGSWSSWSNCTMRKTCEKSRVKLRTCSPFGIFSSTCSKYGKIVQHKNCHESVCGVTTKLPSEKNNFINKNNNTTSWRPNMKCGRQYKSQYKLSTKILGGKAVQTNERHWIWHAALSTTKKESVNFYRYRCGAVIIHKAWAISAAHCLAMLSNDLKENHVDKLPKNKFIDLNNNKINSSLFLSKKKLYITVGDYSLYHREFLEKQIVISHVVIHPDYFKIGGVPFYDMVLLKLSEELEGEIYEQSCLSGNSGNFNECYIVGWGGVDRMKPLKKNVETDKLSKPKFPFKLQEAKIAVRNINYCRQKLFEYYLSNKAHVCAGSKDADTCTGDSGGGLFCLNPDNKQWYLRGITSFGAGCGYLPSVYAKIDLSATNWITEIINGNITS